MIKKFKCAACGKKFDADEKDTILCPKCHSDNVAPVKPNYLKIAAFVFGFLVLVGAGVVIPELIKGNSDSGDVQALIPEEEGDTTVVVKEWCEDVALLDTLKIINSQPVYDKKTKSYSLAVKWNVTITNTTVQYVVFADIDTLKKVKTSSDGHFTNLPASQNESYSYYVKSTICSEDGKCSFSKVREIGGFDPVVEVKTRITKEQLQSMINRGDEGLQGRNPSISNNVRISIQNPSSEERIESFQDVLSYMDFGIWKSVSVVAVDYDSENHVTKVTLSVRR